MTRGLVLPLTAEDRVARMRYLAGEVPLASLRHVDTSIVDVAHGFSVLAEPVFCPTFFYLLKEHNGGKDPRAACPATYWRKPGGAVLNRTCDCIGGMAWCGGWDRYQPVRFASNAYRGWINTDSMTTDALGPATCFRVLERPEPGCYVVFRSGAGGHKVGHIGGVVDVPAEFAPQHREWWDELGVVDVAARAGRANKRTTGRTWFKKDAKFIVSTMTP